MISNLQSVLSFKTVEVAWPHLPAAKPHDSLSGLDNGQQLAHFQNAKRRVFPHESSLRRRGQHSLMPASSHQPSLPAAGLWSRGYHQRRKRTSKLSPWPARSGATALGSLSHPALCRNYKARESLWMEFIANDFLSGGKLSTLSLQCCAHRRLLRRHRATICVHTAFNSLQDRSVTRSHCLHPGGFPGAPSPGVTGKSGCKWVFKNIASGQVTAVIKRILQKGFSEAIFSHPRSFWDAKGFISFFQ